jgi:hypothetical protein
VLIEKTDAWHNDMSPPSHQQRLESLTTAFWSLADARLGVASVIANLHHRRIELRIFERSDVANPSSLARSRLLQERLLPEYATTRARRAVSLKWVPHNDDDLWSFVMLPDAPPVSVPLLRLGFPYHICVGLDDPYQQRVTVHVVRSDPPTPRARVAARAAQRREQEWTACAKEKKLRWRERLEQYDEEYRLREQQGLSPPLAPANSSSEEEEEEEEEEESDGGGPPPRGGIPRPRCHGPRRRPWSWYPRWARKRPPSGHRWRRQQVPRRHQRA